MPHKIAKAGGVVDKLLRACWEETEDPGPYSFDAGKTDWVFRLFEVLPVARLSIDRSGIAMNLAENLARDFPQVVAENFTNEAKEPWATDFKILLQREVVLPRDRDLVAQVASIKKRGLGSGKVAFDAERTARGGHADQFWAIALPCQKERVGGRAGGGTEIGCA